MKKPEIIYIAQTNPGQLGIVNANYPGAVRYTRLDEAEYNSSVRQVIERRLGILRDAVDHKSWGNEDTEYFWKGKITGYEGALWFLRHSPHPINAITALYGIGFRAVTELLEMGNAAFSFAEGQECGYREACELLFESPESIKIEL